MELVASLKGLRRVVFAWISWSGLTRDGSPLVLRDTSSQEVYALDCKSALVLNQNNIVNGD